MTQPSDPSAAADASSLPPRRETFLAHYPRRLKLLVTVTLIVGVALTAGLLAHSSRLVKAQRTVAHSEQNPIAAPNQPVTGDTNSAATTPPANAPVAPTSSPTTDQIQAMAVNDTDDHGARMPLAPIAGLTENTPAGILPRISDDGRQAWQAYERPYNHADQRPRVTIVIMDLGLSGVATDAAIQQLPANVTLAFDAQSPVTDKWLKRAREDGHETLLQVPMEPFDYPHSDPGPNTLLTNLPASDNQLRLDWALARGAGYIGITTLSGSRFTTDAEKVTPVLDELKQRGLMVLDTRIAAHSVLESLARDAHVPAAASDLRLDDDPAPAAIDAALDQLEQSARVNGTAIGIATPLPVTLTQLTAWIKRLPSHGMALAPLSATIANLNAVVPK